MKLNIGSSNDIIPGWVNIDRNPGKGVTVLDVRNGLSYHDNSVELIFSAHCIDHLSFNEVLNFLKECYRVLKIGGTIRITVPDMRKHIIHYLRWKIDNDDKIWIDYVTKDHIDNIYHGIDNLFRILTQVDDDYGDHHSIFTHDILWLRFMHAGFDYRKIVISQYKNSNVEEMRGDKFDNREKFTLFMEAVK